MSRAFVIRCSAAIFLMQSGARVDAHIFSDPRKDIERFEQEMTAAIGHNDVAALERYLSDDWTIVSGQGSVITRATFLKVMASHDLVHESMNPQDQTIRRYGSFAVVTAHIQSGGTYKGASFHNDEIGTDILIKTHGHWVCVLTQLTAVTLK
jgi:ketosteroid isomerase-like protein